MSTECSSVTMKLPAGAAVATIAGHWNRLEDGRIEATFTRDELRLALIVLGGCIECEGDPPCDLCRQRPHRVLETRP